MTNGAVLVAAVALSAGQSFKYDAGWVIFSLAIIVLCIAVARSIDNPSRVFLISLWFYSCYFVSTLSWLEEVAILALQCGAVIGWIIVGMVAAYCAVIASVGIAGIAVLYKNNAISSAFGYACAATMTITEYLRAEVILGGLGIGQQSANAADSPLRYLATLAGSYALTFVIYLVASLVAIKRYRAAAAAAIVMASLSLFGKHVNESGASDAIKTVPFSIVQLPPDGTGTVRTNSHALSELLSHAIPEGRVLLMPESTFPADIALLNRDLRSSLLQQLIQVRSTLLFGSLSVGGGGAMQRSYNSIFMMPSTLISPVYSKSHPTLGGEWLPGWLRVLGINPLAPITPGPLAEASLLFDGAAIHLSICFELLFSDIQRGQVLGSSGAPGLLVNLANFSPLGGGSGVDQMIAAAKLRAVESSRPLILAAKSRGSIVVDHTGKVLHRLNEPVGVVLDVDIRPRHGITPFVRLGNAVVIALSSLILCFCVVDSRLKQKHLGSMDRYRWRW
jgi:apolipoprotein N-acyltransferase